MFTALVVASCLLPADLRHYDNFAGNPSFELDQDRDLAPDGWSGMAFDSHGAYAWDRGTARSGRSSLRLNDPGMGDIKDWKRNTVRWASRESPIEPGTEYSLRVFVRTEEVKGRARAILSWQRDGQYLDQAATAAATGTSEWTSLEITAKAPQRSNGVRVFLELSNGTGAAWFDDIRLSGRSQLPPAVTYVFHDTQDWFPFQFPHDDINRDSIDLSYLLDAPAGKHGFLAVREDGHFYFADGTRARFFGTNLGGAHVAPEKDTARAFAARMAKYGANMIRLHSLDGRSTRLIDYSPGTSQHFDAAVLDRMDYLIAELKKRGIYIYLDLLDYRMFTSADGVKHGDEFTHNWAGSMKGASIFDERMIELQKDYATQLLTHRNPYTGLRYVDDPAIAVLETTNENSVFYFLLNKDLSLPYYRQQLQERWNRWLAERYGSHDKLARQWTGADGRSELSEGEDVARGSVKLPAAELVRFSRGDAHDPLKYRLGPKRMTDALRFLGEIQTHYNLAIRRHLLDNVGVRIPITGTNQTFILCDTQINAATSDFISRNQYWRHPSRRAKPFFKFSNEPMLRSDLVHERGPFTVFASSAVAGKPLMLTEFNFPWPNEYRCEGLLLCSAYACLQDWDAVLLFSYGLEGDRLEMFRSHTDPARWGEFPAAALLFHRSDVSVARNEIHEIHTPGELLQLQPDERYAPTTNFRYLTFLSKVRRAFVEGAYEGQADAVLATGPAVNARVAPGTKVIRIAEPSWKKWLYPQFVSAARALKVPGYERIDGASPEFVSDTGQLTLNFERGVFTADSPRTQGAIGCLADAGTIELTNVSLACQTGFAAVMVQAMDEQPVGKTNHLFVTAVARAENTAQGFWPAPKNPKSWSPYMTWMLPGEGRPPVIAEPVRAVIQVDVPCAVKVYALDATGKRSHTVPATCDGGRVSFDPAGARSIWLEIEGHEP